MGIGISTYGEICALGPSPATPAGGWESATVKIDPAGKVTVMTGCSPHGQGEETTFAQIAADELGVDIDDILVLHGDTAIVQYGIGTFGSRGTAVGGTAMYFALQDLKAKLKKFGAMLLDSDDVTLSGGQVICNKTGATKSVQEIAGATYRAMKLPPNTEPGMICDAFLGASEFHLPVRRAHRGDGYRSGHGSDHDPPVHRGRRLRKYPESADRRRAGARRRRARSRPGAVGAGRL